jgi:hypothetical protein
MKENADKWRSLTEFTWIYRLYRNTARFPCRAFDDSSSSFYQQWHVIEHVKLYVLSSSRHVSVHTHHPQKIILAIRSWKPTAVHVTVKSFILLDCCTIKWLCKRLLKCYKIKQYSTQLYTRWFKYDQDKLWLVYTQIIPVIFEPPCTYKTDVDLTLFIFFVFCGSIYNRPLKLGSIFELSSLIRTCCLWCLSVRV